MVLQSIGIQPATEAGSLMGHFSGKLNPTRAPQAGRGKCARRGCSTMCIS